jgi:phage N-6-adenine-methyltransferase
MGAGDFFKGVRSDEWQTPKEIFEPLNAQYHFTCDLAASKKNKKLKKYFSDSLNTDWSTEIGWLNPPFSQASLFIKKCVGNKVVVIYKAANPETILWQDVIFPNADWICFIRGRTNYINHERKKLNGVSFGSALIGFGVEVPENDFGYVIGKELL